MEEIKEVKEGRLKGLRVGDSCYSVSYGECVVTDIVYGDTYPIKAECNGADVSDRLLNFTLDGKYYVNHKLPTLYFSKPEIIEPPRLKRRVTKTVERWVNVYTADENVHLTKELADKAWCADQRIACVKLVGTYEIEE